MTPDEPGRAGDEEITWALDIDEQTKYPWRAHEIVERGLVNGEWPDEVHTVCGKAIKPWDRSGFWGVKVGKLPMAEWAIHCISPAIAVAAEEPSS